MISNNVVHNRLIYEKSPYLLQHAHNPVNWYPWDEEAFKKARCEDKPIFLSIGYSTCHWCHVMAHESFEDEEVANILNEHFIAIKVDREERPDVDSIYMSACIALNGSGGWPLSVFINDNKEPIYAGTYFPKQDFINLLQKMVNLWKSNRKLLYDNAYAITEYLKSEKKSNFTLPNELPTTTYKYLLSAFDERYGGFSQAPKFPTPHNLLFLLKYYEITKEEKALGMVIKTLDALRAGGIYDQIGYGFHRYSTDEKWLVPHFEKMLYDNVLLLITYLEAYQVASFSRYEKTAKEIITFLLRDMQSPDGGFYTAIDADSENEEGKFYVFSYDEIESLLKEDAPYFIDYFNIKKNGNFEGMNILNLIGKNVDLENEKIALLIHKLYEYRKQRIHPLIDDKILTSFNGLAVAAFAIAGRILDKKYLDVAMDVYQFIKTRLLKDGRLMARYRDGEAKIMGFSEDYAYFIYGLIELYLSTLDEEILSFALALNQTFINHYYDYEEGGFFITPDDGETILFRKKEIYDGATPSGNAIAINNLFRLSYLIEDYSLEEKAYKSLNCFGKEINDYPLGYAFSMINLLLKEHNVMIKIEGQNTKTYIETVENAKIPFYTLKIIKSNDEAKVWVCKNKSCLPPIKDIKELAYTLSSI